MSEMGQRVLATTAAAAVFLTSCGSAVEAYPIFAQQNYADPIDEGGKIACANCHLASKPVDAKAPHDVAADTIFKMEIKLPLKYEKRVQPLADGSKGPLNVGAIAIFPKGWRLAPKDRLPKVLKKEMKGLAWAPYSKEHPEIFVAGPVPGQMYGRELILPVLAPNPDDPAQKEVHWGKATVDIGGNRGRGQVYPEGNSSNNVQWFASTTGTVKSIEGMKITYELADGSNVIQELLPGADIRLDIGEKVKKGDPISTDPNVGGFGQEERDIVLQDPNRIKGYSAFTIVAFFGQLLFVLKKKQFEKVQMAEGF